MWRKVKPHIIRKLFVPFIFYFLIFLVYITMAFAAEMVGGDSENPSEALKWVETSLAIIFILFCVYFLGVEIIQFQSLEEKSEYFTTFWNVLDLLSLMLNIFISFADLVFSAEAKFLRPFVAIAALIMWMKLFYFCRIFDKTSGLIRMILEMTRDM